MIDRLLDLILKYNEMNERTLEQAKKDPMGLAKLLAAMNVAQSPYLYHYIKRRRREGRKYFSMKMSKAEVIELSILQVPIYATLYLWMLHKEAENANDPFYIEIKIPKLKLSDYEQSYRVTDEPYFGADDTPGYLDR